ncbi:hypothetical protein C7M84_010591 [Penaeus vannamei]|uniref:Uncharacterized protein n=1 Tax=Penaeus vannamei TaxID=6689 RepID=A0A423T3U1_PENVA|nr:hypothetical protein C7M84_010591 [Penaeus vannamei]
MSVGGGQTKSIAAIRTALSKIISLNNDFSAVLREHEDTYPLTKTKSVNTSPGDRKRKLEGLNEPEKSKKKADTILEKSCNQPHQVETEEEGCNKTIWNVSSITGKAILEELEKNAASLNVDICVAAKSLVIAQVKLMAGLARDGENFDSKARVRFLRGRTGAGRGSSAGRSGLSKEGKSALVCWVHHLSLY